MTATDSGEQGSEQDSGPCFLCSPGTCGMGSPGTCGMGSPGTRGMGSPGTCGMCSSLSQASNLEMIGLLNPKNNSNIFNNIKYIE